MASRDRTIAVLLTFRRPRLASTSVRYLLDDEGLDPADVIVVVNGEGGLDDDELAAAVTVERLATNTGPAGGMRAGLELAAARADAAWIYLCEDDIGVSGLPAPRLPRLRSLMAERDAAGSNPIGAVAAYSRLLDPRTGLTTPHLPGPDDPPLVPTDVASWGATLVSHRVVEAGILPDADLFFGYEDFDFWLSMRAAGFEFLLDTDCARDLGRSVHPSGRDELFDGERKVDDTTPWRRYYEARNFLHLRRRHGHTGWTAAHLAKSVRRASLGGRDHRRAIATGLYHGFRGRTGLVEAYQRRTDEDETASGAGHAEGSGR